MNTKSKTAPKEWSELGESLVAGMAAFVAPLVGLATVAAITSNPHADLKKSIARLRHPSRFRFSPREMVLRDATLHGHTLDDAARSLKLSDAEATSILSALRTNQQAKDRQSSCL